ncbi:hypothetical protein ABZ930_08125 [Streptomyces sp. NPDC046716]|uniref:hypothetical protein n=1 Tax=Streptomyces sp. NPDC046716 TaxID=3157093 RepID=UPI0033C5B997
MYRSPERVVELIRREHAADPGLSLSGLAQRHRVSRAVVRAALDLTAEPTLPPAQRPRPLLLDPVSHLIDDMLRQEIESGARLSNQRILQRLASEAGFEAASLSTLRNYVHRRRPQLQAETDGHDAGPDRGEGRPAPSSC